MDPVPWRSLTPVCSLGGSSLIPSPAPAEVTESGMLLWRSLAQACSPGGCWLKSVPAWNCSHRDSGFDMVHRGLWVWPAPSAVTLSYLFLCRSLTWACSRGGCSLGSAPVKVAGLGLLAERLLARAWPHRGDWLGSAPVEVTVSGLFLHMPLA